MAGSRIFAGLMSGTSLDGVDAVVVDFASEAGRLIGRASVPYEQPLREALRALCTPGNDELNRAAELGNRLSDLYATAVQASLREAGLAPAAVAAIGCHGQTVRHAPERGYTIQLVNAARLAELAGIDVICDFRSRDIAAGGQGAPLAPAFHAAAFGAPDETRCVLNLGGIANITALPRAPGKVSGFDTGPANCLLDEWCERHTGVPYDEDGRWSRQGNPLQPVLATMLADPYFDRPAPKSTGRDYFDLGWVAKHLRGDETPVDVQATLLELSAQSVARAIARHAPATSLVIACGGGVRNGALMERLSQTLGRKPLVSSEKFGCDPRLVEPIAFAWLACQTADRRPGNIPSVTGASGPRVLGCVYPA